MAVNTRDDALHHSVIRGTPMSTTRFPHVRPAALTERQTTASGGKDVRKSEPNTQLPGREPLRSPRRTAGNSSKVNRGGTSVT